VILRNLYYADIYNSSGQFDTWDKNNNILGEYNSNCNIDKPELYSDVSIGRIPVSNTTELNNYIQKVFYYENNNIELWFKKHYMFEKQHFHTQILLKVNILKKI
jgi:hypothetical protein